MFVKFFEICFRVFRRLMICDRDFDIFFAVVAKNYFEIFHIDIFSLASSEKHVVAHRWAGLRPAHGGLKGAPLRAPTVQFCVYACENARRVSRPLAGRRWASGTFSSPASIGFRSSADTRLRSPASSAPSSPASLAPSELEKSAKNAPTLI